MGVRPRLLASIERLKGKKGSRAEKAIAHMSRATENPKHSRRFFAVGFRDSNVRIVFPDDDDPLRYHQQIVATEASGFEISVP